MPLSNLAAMAGCGTSSVSRKFIELLLDLKSSRVFSSPSPLYRSTYCDNNTNTLVFVVKTALFAPLAATFSPAFISKICLQFPPSDTL